MFAVRENDVLTKQSDVMNKYWKVVYDSQA